MRIAILLSAACVLATAMPSASMAALSEESAGICAEEASVLLPKIPSLVVNQIDYAGEDGPAERALNTAGWQAPQLLGAGRWVDRLIEGRYEALTLSEIDKVRSLVKSGNAMDANKIINDGIRHRVYISGNQVGTITLRYTGGAIKGSQSFACLFMAGRPLVLPLGRP
jgi:hypothetical protein